MCGHLCPPLNSQACRGDGVEQDEHFQELGHKLEQELEVEREGGTIRDEEERESLLSCLLWHVGALWSGGR